MPFDAAKVVSEDDLNFDFTAVGGPKGTIPEPARETLDAYWQSVQEGADAAGIDRDAMLESERLGGSETPEGRVALAQAVADTEPEKLREMTQGRIEAIAALCAGTPSREEIDGLPYRVQEAFFAWLMEKFSRPTNLNGASSS